MDWIWLLLRQGALLLVLFQLSHALEESLTAKASGSLASLLERAPQTATLIDFSPGSNGAEPDFSKLKEERAGEVPVGAQMLVRPGELVSLFLPLFYLSLSFTSSYRLCLR